MKGFHAGRASKLVEGPGMKSREIPNEKISFPSMYLLNFPSLICWSLSSHNIGVTAPLSLHYDMGAGDLNSDPHVCTGTTLT